MNPPDPERRAHAARTINALGAVISLDDLEVCAETVLPFGPDRRVLRGLYQGMAIADAENMELGHLLRKYDFVRRSVITFRPWWRWWQETRAVRFIGYARGGAS